MNEVKGLIVKIFGNVRVFIIVLAHTFKLGSLSRKNVSFHKLVVRIPIQRSFLQRIGINAILNLLISKIHFLFQPSLIAP